MRPFPIDPVVCQFPHLAGSCDAQEIVWHITKGFEDHRIIELAGIGTSAPREGDRSRVRLVAGHGLRAADRRPLVGTFHRLAGSHRTPSMRTNGNAT